MAHEWTITITGSGDLGEVVHSVLFTLESAAPDAAVHIKRDDSPQDTPIHHEGPTAVPDYGNEIFRPQGGAGIYSTWTDPNAYVARDDYLAACRDADNRHDTGPGTLAAERTAEPGDWSN